MRDLRAFSPNSSESPGEFILSASESHHLVVVNRGRQGDLVIVFDGKGNEWECRLEDASRNAARLKVLSLQRKVHIPFQITLAQVLPKGSVMDDIVRKATEIGVAEIVPLSSERSQVHLNEERSEKKREKWHITALEAAKQCGNPWIPQIAEITQADTFMRVSQDFDLKLIGSLQAGAYSLKHALDEYFSSQNFLPGKVLWMIGPEGDFSPQEMELAMKCGFCPITLGPLVLRCETAVIYALSILSYELRNRLQ